MNFVTKFVSFVALCLLLTVAAFAQSQVAVVNSGGFAPLNQVAPNSIASAFGGSMSNTTVLATSVPLPTSLDGVSVAVNGTDAPLFFVSPNQINFLIPGFTSLGTASISVKRNGSVTHVGSVNVLQIVAGFFNQGTTNNLQVNSGYVTDYFTGSPSKDTKFWEFNNTGATVIKSIPAFVTGHNYYGIFYLTGAAAGNTNYKLLQMQEVNTGFRISLNADYSGPSFQFAGLDQFNVKLNNENGYLFPKGLYLCWGEWTNNGTSSFVSSNKFYILYQ
jgi:uncharacterized protein (TIGR03437 family)